MRRVLPWIVLVVLTGLTFLPSLLYVVGDESAEEVDEPTRITRYNAVLEVDERGDLEVTETLIVRFPGDDRHGIFRFFDEYDRNDRSARRAPRRVVVTRDGRPEQVERSTRQQGRLHVLRIGDPEATVPAGEHTYVIRYEVEDVLLDTGDGSRLQWDVVPAGWAQRIDAAELTVRLPDAPRGDVRCAVGTDRTDGCDAQVSGSTLTVRVQDLEPRTPVTVGADLAAPPPESDSRLAWPVFLAPVLGRSPWLLATVLLAAVGVGYLGRRIAAPMVEEPPDFLVQYAPPPGVGPAQAAYVLTERTDRTALAASLMHAAERGAVTLEQREDGWVLTRTGADLCSVVDDATAVVLETLCPADGDRFEAASDDTEAGQRLQEAQKALVAATKSWARQEGHVTQAGLGSLAGIGVVAALVLFGVLVPALNATMSIVALVPGAFAAMALPVLYPGATTKRTDTGRELWARVGGFRQALARSTLASSPGPAPASPSAGEWDLPRRPELFAAHLPWAVAFGCADEWAQTYRVTTSADPVHPVWVMNPVGGGAVPAGSFVDSFSSTLDGAISSYQSSQADSVSSGSAGGGGGGGGGSW